VEGARWCRFQSSAVTNCTHRTSNEAEKYSSCRAKDLPKLDRDHAASRRPAQARSTPTSSLLELPGSGKDDYRDGWLTATHPKLRGIHGPAGMRAIFGRAARHHGAQHLLAGNNARLELMHDATWCSTCLHARCGFSAQDPGVCRSLQTSSPLDPSPGYDPALRDHGGTWASRMISPCTRAGQDGP